VDSLKCRLSILNSMDEKLKMIDEFNAQLKEFDKITKELADWLGVGRKRMDELVNLGTVCSEKRS
jgi:tape measure domain-containing protein